MSRPETSTTPTDDGERQVLEQSVHARSERADVVTWARELLAVAEGQTYAQVAAIAGRRSDKALSKLVARFNQGGLAALEPHPHGKGGPQPTYDAAAQERILAEARRTPDPQRDGTATWSLMTLRNALRRAPDGLPHVSTYTIGQVLHAAGFRWVAAPSWCDTGKAVRVRRSGTVTVTDPDAETKKISLSERIVKEPDWAWQCGQKMRPVRTQRVLIPDKTGPNKANPNSSRMSTYAMEPPSY